MYQTADALGWDSDSSEAPFGSANATPTPQAVRPSTPASVVEISREEFPPLAASAPATATKPRTKTSKGKGKKKASVATNVEDDPFLAADIERAKAASLSLTTSMDHATDGASSSRRPEADPGSPTKCLHANTTGDAAPAPFGTLLRVRPPPPPLPPHPPPPPLARSAPRPTALQPRAVVTPAMSSTAPGHMPAPAADATYAAAVTAVAPIAAPAPVAAAAAPAVGILPVLRFQPHHLLARAAAPRRPPDLTRMYDAVAQPKFFIVVSGGNGAIMRTHGLIREALGNFVNIDPTSFTLGTPPTAANGTSPALWLAADIPPQLAQAIIDNRIISSTKITLFPLPYNMPVIGFVGVFAGFTLPNNDAGANAARDLIRTAIAGNSEITQFVQTHRDAFGPQVSAEQAWAIFLASVSVHGITLLVNDTHTIAWRLYVDPPTNDRTLGQCRRLFGKLHIMTRSMERRVSNAHSDAHLPCRRPSNPPLPSPAPRWLARPPPLSPRLRTRAAPPPPKPKSRCDSILSLPPQAPARVGATDAAKAPPTRNPAEMGKGRRGMIPRGKASAANATSSSNLLYIYEDHLDMS
ncbi:hypothetical protein B0H13DRAFT_2377640 [Mycena leptocephala]|nr:hypothetical protein B0H13DRAFT_2377640 [Mycena leptocephala]